MLSNFSMCKHFKKIIREFVAEKLFNKNLNHTYEIQINTVKIIIY